MTVAIASLLARRSVAKREIEMLLGAVLKASRASVIAHPERILSEAESAQFESFFAARARGTPMAYILGEREFYGRRFFVSPAVLIPRPETELLVDQALTRLSGHSSVLDLGTGSGAIAISIAAENPMLAVTASDVSPDAIEVARKNATALGTELEFVTSHWFTELAGRKFDGIVSNPPYIAHGDPHLGEGDLRFEPSIALTDNEPNQGGLSCIRRIIEAAPAHLNVDGILMFEHGHDQSAACASLLATHGFVGRFCINDLAGIPRVSGGRWPR
jgi:release factor glutamine methyltransferase